MIVCLLMFFEFFPTKIEKNKKMCSFDQPFLLKTKKCFLRLYLELNLFVSKKKQFLSFRKNYVFIFCFCIFLQKYSRFLKNTSFVSLFKSFFLPPSLLVPLVWFLSSSWIFLSSFFHRLFSFVSFTLFSLFFSFFEHMFFLFH